MEKKEPGPGGSSTGPGLKVVRPGAPPPCLASGEILCRGCPGWIYMIKAYDLPQGGWRDYPIHCSATGLTVRPKD